MTSTKSATTVTSTTAVTKPSISATAITTATAVTSAAVTASSVAWVGNTVLEEAVLGIVGLGGWCTPFEEIDICCGSSSPYVGLGDTLLNEGDSGREQVVVDAVAWLRPAEVRTRRTWRPPNRRKAATITTCC